AFGLLVLFLCLAIGATSHTAQAVGGYSSQYAGQSTASSMAPGSQQTVYVDYLNTGTKIWSSAGATPVRLGTSHPKDRVSSYYDASWLAASRPNSVIGRVNGDGSVTPTATVSPGEKARFQFTITAPTSPNTYREYFQPVVETVTWLEDYGQF